MIAILATMQVQPDKAKEFEAAFAAMTKAVRADEPGNVTYQLVKSRTEANTYKVMELYKDQAAIDVHGKSDGFRAAGAGLGACLAGRPTIEFLDGVG
jgi:quinol monooxygenase YgiN